MLDDAPLYFKVFFIVIFAAVGYGMKLAIQKVKADWQKKNKN